MRDDLLVLCYHGVSPDWPSALAVEPDEFGAHLEILVRRGYRGATFSDAINERVRGRVAVVTFDDGLLSVWQHARPVLAAHGWPATVFVPTAYAAHGALTTWGGNELWADTPWIEDLRCMGWDELRGLAGEGWELGSHSHTHPDLAAIGDDALAEELERSRAEVEKRSGGPCRTIAYPYGSVDARVMRAAHAAGYEGGAATYDDGEGCRHLRWPRLIVARDDRARRFSIKSLPEMRRALSIPALARAKARIQAESR